MDSARTRHELRCSCHYKPMLATYGIDKKGRVYLHVRVYKADRIYAELISYGEIDICCRDCRKWQTINIHQDSARAELSEVDAPEIGPRPRFS